MIKFRYISSFLYINFFHSINNKSTMTMLKRITSKMQQLRQTKSFQSNSQNSITPIINLEWRQIKAQSNIVKKRSHHSSSIHQKKMYVYGGYQSGYGVLKDFVSYDFQNKKWEKISLPKQGCPGPLHSHSSIIYKDKLVIFGGIVNTLESTNKTFQYDITENKWSELKTKNTPCAINSHLSVLFENKMIVFGGQSQSKYQTDVLSLNLDTLQWSVLLTLHGSSCPKPRSDCAGAMHNENLYIFGGKMDDHKYNQLWLLNLKSLKFTQIQTNVYFTPFPRSGHGLVIYNDNIIIFGGTTGVTHERNDLVIYNIKNNFWRRHWQDSQSLKNEYHDQEVPQVLKKSSVKKSRSNSMKKMSTSTFSQSKNIDKSQCDKGFQGQGQDCVPVQSNKKYRKQMKQANYYNENYPFYGDKQGLKENKQKKNDLLIDLERQSKDDKILMKSQPIHLSQTFESLNHSVLSCLVQNNGKITDTFMEEKQKIQKPKIPKPRDGHSCLLQGGHMIVFGGDRHHMSYNDIVAIDLDRIIGKPQPTNKRNTTNQNQKEGE